MRTIGMAAAAASALVCGTAVPAAADPPNPLEVIEQLELAGYTVNIDRIGSAPIQECVVTGVRNPQQVTAPVLIVDGPGHRGGHHGGGHHDGPFDRRGDLDVVEVVVHQSISVSLDCTR
ncbi:hypothetical protein JDV09_15705 [Mycobacterium sp. Y57]|uniref:hypothetical protein n=1 Tax=Mycolicibacterium xanthum TaxID=2796469 RepID=UPI001C842923|nr:hypothetical protein [Mycolicibacterium xanthum]MBX7433547.1 hypothetical protein [Mycolicibacterium xanthum]